MNTLSTILELIAKRLPCAYQASGTVSGTISLANAGGKTKVELNRALISVGSGFSLSDGGVKVDKAGVYSVTASVYIRLTGDSTEACVYIQKGSAFESSEECTGTKEHRDVSGNSDLQVVTTKLIRLDAGDIVYLVARVIGGNGTAHTGNSATYLDLERIAVD